MASRTCSFTLTAILHYGLCGLTCDDPAEPIAKVCVFFGQPLILGSEAFESVCGFGHLAAYETSGECVACLDCRPSAQ
jgi:hypothetical protein